MNKLYRLLGIESSLIDQNISKELILEQAEAKDAELLGNSLANVDGIRLKYSVEGAEGTLQVIEVSLNTPENIEEIAKLLQKTIKYRILFVFVYDDRYLIMSRSFKVTESTGYVYTGSTSCCTDWIYGEELVTDMLYSYSVSSDLLRNAAALNKSIIESAGISFRRFVDWFNCHVIGGRISLDDVMERAAGRDIIYMEDDSVFFDKSQLSFICAELINSYFVNEIGRTGRDPRRYFEGAKRFASFDQEDEFVSDYYLFSDRREYADYDDALDYRTTGNSYVRDLIYCA